jgi:hypothetical protein
MRLFGSRTTTFVSRIAAVVLAVGTAGALGTATAHASSGGGCHYGGGSGYSYVVACISASGYELLESPTEVLKY